MSTQSKQDRVIVTELNRLREIQTPIIIDAVKQAVREMMPDNADPDAKAFLTNEEACRYLGLAKPTLARYRSEGRIPYHRLGGSVYYSRKDLEAVLEKGRVNKPAYEGQ